MLGWDRQVACQVSELSSIPPASVCLRPAAWPAGLILQL